MTMQPLLLLLIFLSLLFMLAYPLGRYLAAVGRQKSIPYLIGLEKIEHGLYRLARVSPQDGMTWQRYTYSLLFFNVIGTLFVYVLQRIQAWLPLNPQHWPNVSPDSSLNTAVSFVTNTNWQGYSGETTMSYLTQMVGLTGQNFFSAATGIAVLFAFIRGFTANSCKTIGNFWIDITRIILYVLLPLSTLFAIFLMSQGVIQNFSAYQPITLLEKAGQTELLPMGPVASQEAIKLLGSNGGGFFNVNSAHPYENPTWLSNFLQMLVISLLPTSLCFAFGVMVGDRRQGLVILAAMSVIFISFSLVVMYSEQQANPAITQFGVDELASPFQAGGNMEGKETRFGIVGSALFASLTTGVSCGAVNSMFDSYTPSGGMMLLMLMQLGEVVFGGVGSGLYTMLIFAIVAVFVAGLMIGRTPEYLGKKIQSFEIKMTSITILVTPALVLIGTAIAVMIDAGRAGIANPGAHGFSEVLYAFSSTANNNGSAFAGLSVNTPFYNVILAVVMWFGRFGMIVPILAIAGSLAAKKRLQANAGTMPTHGLLFIILLVGTVLIIGVLNYVPALALGPIVEQLGST